MSPTQNVSGRGPERIQAGDPRFRHHACAQSARDLLTGHPLGGHDFALLQSESGVNRLVRDVEVEKS